MDILPPINKVFALISQEQKQRKIGTRITFESDQNGGAAFAFKTDNSKGICLGSHNNSSRIGNVINGNTLQFPRPSH